MIGTLECIGGCGTLFDQMTFDAAGNVTNEDRSKLPWSTHTNNEDGSYDLPCCKPCLDANRNGCREEYGEPEDDETNWIHAQ